MIRAEQEYEFIRKNRISCLSFHDEAYPSRLRECEDAPVVLFFKGNADLNSLHILNMVEPVMPLIMVPGFAPLSYAI